MSTFVLCVGCGEPLYGFSPCRWCTCERCGVDMLNGICSLCNSSNSCAYDHNPNSFDYPPGSYHPPHPTYETYSGDTCGNNSHFGYDCPPRFSLNYEPEPGCIQNYNSYPHDSPSLPQQYPCCEDCGACQIVQNKLEEKQLEEEQAAKAQNWKLPACYDDDDDEESSNSLKDNIISELLPYFAITPNEPVDSLSMGDEYLNTISGTESDEFIKSCVKNLVPNPSESEGEKEYDVPAGFTTFSNVLFNAEYDFDSSDDQSFSDEDLLKNIYSNPLFDEEIIPMKIDPHSFNAESDLIESIPNHDSSIIISSKIDSLFDEFAGELILIKSIPLGIDETDCHPDKETPLTHMEEINLPFTPDDPIPPSIEDDDHDSERDISILEELLDNYSLSLPDNESYHFDIPLPYRPPAKPPDGKTGTLNIKMIGDVSDQKVPIPGLTITRILNQENSHDLLPHQGLEAFQHSAECPMIINEKNTPLFDVPLFHFYPLDQTKYGGN
nr:pre-mRNA splicing Prp18-interacting factor [Tanacetum cinerariifolium]